MGCGSSTSGTAKGSYKPTFLQKKKDFMKHRKIKHLKMIQDLSFMAKQIKQFNKDPEKVINDIQKFNDVEKVLGGNDITKPISDCIKQIPEVMEPVVKKIEPTLKKMEDEAEKFQKKMGSFVEAIDDMFKLVKQAQKGKVVDKPKRFINACRLLEYLVTQVNQQIDARDFGDEHVPLLKILKAIVLIEKIGKSVATIVKLCEQKIPFVGKSVKDYLESGGSNPLVKMAKGVINKLTDPIRKKVERATDVANMKVGRGFPNVDEESPKFVGLKLVKKGKTLDVAASLPSKFATMEIQLMAPEMVAIQGEMEGEEEDEEEDES